ncbi:MAG: cytidine deaminase [Deltaproteobacteria bacterium]|nr:MAG: cytidine deaminase [Deltaproteobacteria bacterium]
MNRDAVILDELEQDAREVAKRAYAPYSGFRVGAALRTRSGRTFTGCNVENASYGATTCAERNAIAAAVAAGEQQITHIAIHTPTPHPVSPCGICRQVLLEFGRDIVVRSSCDGSGILLVTSADLLPHAFTSEDLAGESSASATEPASRADDPFGDDPRTEVIRPPGVRTPQD